MKGEKIMAREDDLHAAQLSPSLCWRASQVDQRFRWVPHRLNQLEHAAACWVPPIHETADQLRRAIVGLVRSNASVTEDKPSASPHDAVSHA